LELAEPPRMDRLAALKAQQPAEAARPSATGRQ